MLLDCYTTLLDRAAVSVAAALARDDYTRALKRIHAAVELVITDARMVCEIYGSPTLDVLCTEIGSRVFAAFPPPLAEPSTQESYAYIATKLQRSGGHTRVMLDFIRTRPNARHVILLTEREGPSDHTWLTDILRDLPCVSIMTAPHGNALKALRWLQAQLIAAAPQHSYLFNHHADSVAVAALVPEMNLAGSFCHHGDHNLSLGVYLPHLTHLDFHPMGYHQCRGEAGIANRYVPLTTMDRGARDVALPFMVEGTLTTATVAGANKLERPYATRYVEVVPALLAATGGHHIHIGRLSRHARVELVAGMAAQNIFPDRFVYIPWVASVWEALIAHRVDLHICSFPYGGALTLVEAMGAGIPSAAHRHLFHRMLGVFDMGYAGMFNWRDPDKLINHCASLTPAKLTHESIVARSHYERYHRRDLLGAWLSSDAPIAPVADLWLDYASDVSAGQTECNRGSTPTHMARRFLHRTYRRIRRLRANF